MIKPYCFAAAIVLAATSVASAGMANYPGISKYNYWRGEACGDGGEPGSQCERAFKRLCGKTPSAACVKRHQKVFDKADKFR